VPGLTLPAEDGNTAPVHHLYVVQSNDRDGLQKHLQSNGISTGIHYPIPLHRQKAYARLKHAEGSFPVTEEAARRILSLPMFPELTEEQIRQVAEQIHKFT
jgi:dTDP-4-amino-4,6-dideoxygalactose transaminase